MPFTHRIGAAVFALALLQCNGATSPSKTPDTAAAKFSPEPKSAATTTAVATTTAPSVEPSTPRVETPPSPPKVELPRGGRELFPAYRLVGFCGTPGAPALGKLAGNLGARAKTIESYGEKYARGRKALPVFELIAVVVQGTPGPDGKWRRRVPNSVVDDYLKAARAAKAILLLNLQPGHSDFITEAKYFEKYLKEPDVGLALDPEWQMHGKQKPGVFFGQTNADAINEVGDYLSGLIKAGDLPEKALVYHQVNGHVVADEANLKDHPGVALIKGVDGLGPQGAKINTYNYLVKSLTGATHPGFKLFFDEDTANGGKLMSPEQVMTLKPEPEYVMYE